MREKKCPESPQIWSGWEQKSLATASRECGECKGNRTWPATSIQQKERPSVWDWPSMRRRLRRRSTRVFFVRTDAHNAIWTVQRFRLIHHPAVVGSLDSDPFSVTQRRPGGSTVRPVFIELDTSVHRLRRRSVSTTPPGGSKGVTIYQYYWGQTMIQCDVISLFNALLSRPHTFWGSCASCLLAAPQSNRR